VLRENLASLVGRGCVPFFAAVLRGRSLLFADPEQLYSRTMRSLCWILRDVSFIELLRYVPPSRLHSSRKNRTRIFLRDLPIPSNSDVDSRRAFLDSRAWADNDGLFLRTFWKEPRIHVLPGFKKILFQAQTCSVPRPFLGRFPFLRFKLVRF